MEADIIVVTDHIEIHPGVNRYTGEPNGTWSVVRDGLVAHSGCATLAHAQQIADEFADETGARS